MVDEGRCGHPLRMEWVVQGEVLAVLVELVVVHQVTDEMQGKMRTMKVWS